MSHAENGDLPEGWHQSEIKDIGDARMGETILAKDLSNEGIPVYSAGQANEVWGLLSSPKRTYDKHSIVVSARGSIGFPKIPKHEPFTCTQTTICLTTTDSLVARYACYFLQTRDWASITSGGAIPMLTVGEINKHKIPIAPLAEQRRIVEKLDAVLGKVDACRQRLERIPTILKRFRQSVLAAACSGKLTTDWGEGNTDNDDLPAGWEWKELLELIPKGGIFDGPFGSNLKTSDYATEGIRVVRLENIGHLEFFADKQSFISKEKFGQLKKHEVFAGDIIFSSFIADEIRVTILPEIPTGAIAKADCFCIRPSTDIVTIEYLTIQLACQNSYNQLVEKVHGATRPRVNTTQLRSLKLRVCPIPEQEEIVRRVNALFALADNLETRYQKAKVHVDKLTQSVLAKAFWGGLVPTEAELAKLDGREYEPASVLLERIQAERETRPKTARKKATRKRAVKKRS